VQSVLRPPAADADRGDAARLQLSDSDGAPAHPDPHAIPEPLGRAHADPGGPANHRAPDSAIADASSPVADDATLGLAEPDWLACGDGFADRLGLADCADQLAYAALMPSMQAND
jgi:hypothetical protein